MAHPYRVLFAAAEAAPLVKIGGLGDVIGSLPAALRHAQHDARVVIPHYKTIDLAGYQPESVARFEIDYLSRNETIQVSRVVLTNGVPVYLIANTDYFGRDLVYGEWDDPARFVLFCRALLELPRQIGWQPEILHCHDWHTAILPALLKTHLTTGDESFANCSTVYTIHNMAYQGWFDDGLVQVAGIGDCLPPLEDPLRSQAYNLSALGIYHASAISTVSETYAREILTPEFGAGLETLLQHRVDHLVGILNGIDYQIYNPANDPDIAVQYDVADLDRRIENKITLQSRAGLMPQPESPLLGMAGRLVEQKGLDIALPALERLLAKSDVQVVIQGVGDERLRQMVRELRTHYPERVGAFLEPNFKIVQMIFAGCDIFAAPSRFEPCGLTPMIAMRYGAIPLVRRTGGMVETVPEFSPEFNTGLGFVFEEYSTEALVSAAERAIDTYRNTRLWRSLMRRVMLQDYSWTAAVVKYEALYKLSRRRFETIEALIPGDMESN